MNEELRARRAKQKHERTLARRERARLSMVSHSELATKSQKETMIKHLIPFDLGVTKKIAEKRIASFLNSKRMVKRKRNVKSAKLWSFPSNLISIICYMSMRPIS
jgi:hypothetical protein